MNLRLRLMSLLGLSVERVSSATVSREIRKEDEARLARLGPLEPAAENLRLLAEDLNQRATRLQAP